MVIKHDQVASIHGLYQTPQTIERNIVNSLTCHRTVVSQPCSLGSQTVFLIPNDSFLGTCVLSWQMSSTIANQYLTAQFAANAVKSLRVRLGGSEEIYLPVKECFFYQYCQSASSGKQNEITGLVGKVAPASTTTPNYYLLLNLMSFSGAAKRIPLPAYLLNSPIQLVVEWSPISELGAGSAISSYSTNFTASLITEQMVPFKEGGLIKLSPSQSYTHHFKRPFSLAPIATSASTAQQTFNLQGIPAGQVNGILAYLVKQTDESALSWQYGRPMNNLQLLLNGSVLHNYPGGQTLDGYNCYDAFSVVHTGGVTQALVNYNNSGSNATATVPFYFLMMGSENMPEQMQNEERVSNGISLANQTLQIKFEQASADAMNLHVVFFLEYKLDILGTGQVQIQPVME